VVERVVEVFRLTVVVAVVLMLVTVVTRLTTLSAFRTWATLSALWAWTALTLYVSLRLRDETAVRELVLARLRVYL
jgi:hypothetical protein